MRRFFNAEATPAPRILTIERTLVSSQRRTSRFASLRCNQPPLSKSGSTQVAFKSINDSDIANLAVGLLLIRLAVCRFCIAVASEQDDEFMMTNIVVYCPLLAN